MYPWALLEGQPPSDPEVTPTCTRAPAESMHIKGLPESP